jgi:hypothetical protein
VTSFDVVETDGGDGRPDDGTARPRRRRHALVGALLIGVPVLAVVLPLAVRATGGSEADVVAAEPAVSEAAGRVAQASPGSTTTFGGGTLAAGRPMSGSSEVAPASGAMDLTVVCASLDGRPARVTVRLDGETVAERSAACADASSAVVEPATTVIPTLEVAGAWSFEVVPESTSAVAVVMS